MSEDTSEGIGTLVNVKITYYGPIRSADIISIGGYEFRVGEAKGDDIDDSPVPEVKNRILKIRTDDADFRRPGYRAETLEEKEESLGKQRLHVAQPYTPEVLRMMDLRRTDVYSMDEDELRAGSKK